MAITQWNGDQYPMGTPDGGDGQRPHFPQNRRAPQPQPPTPSGIDIFTLWAAVRDQWKFIARVGASVLLVALTATLLMRPNFKATGRLYLGELDAKNKAAAAAGEFDIVGGGPSDVASELEIIKSRSLLLQAIATSGLNASIVPKGWTSPRMWKWLLLRRDPRLMQGAKNELAVTSASLAEGALEPQAFEVRFTSPREYELYAEHALVAKGELDRELKIPAATFTLHAAPTGGPQTGAAYDLTVAPLDDAVDKALDGLTVTAAKLSASSSDMVKVITLDFAHRSPPVAARFLKDLMHAYLDERQAWKTADATAAETFVSDQLSGMRQSLDGTQKKLADYRSTTSGVVMDNEAKAMIEQMAKYEEQRVAARLQVSSLSDIKRILKNPNPPVEAYLLGEASDTVLEGLGRSLAASRQQLTDLQGKFHDTAPDVINQKAQIAAQLETIRNYVTGRLARAQENLNALTGIIQQFETKLKTVPGAELGLSQLSRESDVYSKLYSYLLERQQQAAIQKASTVSKNRVLDMPQVPGLESAPRVALSLASGIIGLVLGICIVIFRRFCATTLQSEVDVRQAVGGAPLLASVPHWSKLTAGRSEHVSSIKMFDSMISDGLSSSAEAFRTLRTNLYQSGRVRAGHVILLTSPSSGDGKTLTTLSLAAMLAADQKWVLVLDADLRKPSHHKLTGGDEGAGLRGVLNGQANWRDVVRPISGKFGEFFSIAAGRPSPGELSSERMARFLIDARSRYDFVLIDGPSFPLFADALLLSPLADEVVTVVRLGHTPRDITEEHVRRIAAAAHAHSVVVNDAAPVKAHSYTRSSQPPPPRGGLSKLWTRSLPPPG